MNINQDIKIPLIIPCSSGPLGGCHASIDPGPMYSACVYSACSAQDGDPRSYCAIIETYAQICQDTRYVTVQEWRSEEVCRKYNDIVRQQVHK